MVALAAVCTLSSFAFNSGEYVYTASQRYKITGDNLVSNGTFENSTNGWSGDSAIDEPNASVWGVTEGAGPNGENALTSKNGATTAAPLTKSWEVVGGTTYLLSLQVNPQATFTTAISSVDDTDASNCIDVFGNLDGGLARAEGDVSIATAQECKAGEWTQLAFLVTVDDTKMTNIVLRLGKLPEGVMVTNISLNEAQAVYDTRILAKKLNYIELLMNDENFNVEAAADARGMLEEVVLSLKGSIETEDGTLDDESDAASTLTGLNEMFEEFLGVTSENLTSDTYFKNIDITTVGKYNRGQIANGNELGNWRFYGDNWYHSSGSVEWTKYIGPGSGNHNAAGTVALFNAKLPAGKYFVSAEIRNGLSAKNWATLWNHVEAPISGYLGKGLRETNKVDFGTIEGEEWSHLFYVLELPEGVEFEAGFWWDAPDITNPSGVVFMKNFEVRAFGKVADIVARKEAWSGFIAQYNAMESARKKLLEMQDDATLPWGKDTLTAARAQWDPFYEAFKAKGWVDADGNDTGVATIDELKDWATTTGVEGLEAPYDKYALVRGYQYATAKVTNENASITALPVEIENAKTILADDMYSVGDKATFAAAIDAAQATYDNTLATTTDATREADEPKFVSAKETLIAAEEAFKKSGSLTPVISIDFSNKPEQQTTPIVTDPATGEEIGGEVYYTIKGAAGEMTFDASAIQTDYSAESSEWDSWLFSIGYKDELPGVLHVGGSAYGYVELPEIGSEDVVRVQYDVWYGNLGGGYLTIDLVDADNNVIAGTSLDRYRVDVGYNTFQNEEGTGMDLKQATGQGSSSVGNAGICIDANKTQLDLIIDRKYQAVKGTLSVNGVVKSEGAWVPLPALATAEIAKFRIGSTTYQKANGGAMSRRCWFDNLVIYKYASTADGPIKVVIPGDANGDGEVNITDVTYVLDKINGVPADNFVEKAADVNADGEVNITDVTLVLDIINSAK